ncbi:MAG: hypothetical protein ABEL97_09210 [Salinibacter sp.]
MNLSSWVARLRGRVVRLKDRIQRWADTSVGRRVTQGLRHGVTIAVLAYLVYQMTRIGWGNIWTSLPTTPWFYVLFLALYFLLPVFQSIGYSLIWGGPARRLFLPLLKTGVYNKEVLDYSGEMYLFSWARARLERPARQIARHIKDHTIVSAGASTANAVVVLAVLLVADLISLPTLAAQKWAYLAAGGVGVVGLGAMGARFWRSVFTLSGGTLLGLFGLYVGRLFLLQGLQVAQWAVALPEVAIQTWLTFLAIQIVTKRIPLMPSQDLLFMAVGLKVAGTLQVPQAGLAGVLAVHSVLDKGLGLMLFAFVSWRDRRDSHPPTVPDGPPEEPRPDDLSDAPSSSLPNSPPDAEHPSAVS